VDGCAHLLCGVVTCDVPAVRLCAGCAGGGHRGGEGAVDLAGDIALDAAADLAVAFAIGTATGDVGLGGGVGADPRVGDDVDRLVQRPVADPVKSVAGGLLAGGLDRAGPSEFGERGVVAAATGVGERHDGLGGADRADPCRVVSPGVKWLTMAADLGLAYGLLPAGLAGLAAPGQPSQGGVGEAGAGRCSCRLAYHRER
jgi:hypothetical protein